MQPRFTRWAFKVKTFFEMFRMSFPLGFISFPHVSSNHNPLAMTQSHCDAVMGIAWWVSYVNLYPIWTAGNLLARLSATVITTLKLHVTHNLKSKMKKQVVVEVSGFSSSFFEECGSGSSNSKLENCSKRKISVWYSLAAIYEKEMNTEKYWYSEIAETDRRKEERLPEI